jgi:hypothetical protein
MTQVCPSAAPARLTGYGALVVCSPAHAAELAAGVAADWALRRMLWQGNTIAAASHERDGCSRGRVSPALDGRPFFCAIMATGQRRTCSG